MKLTRPKVYLAGFWTADLGELSSELGMVGEAWTVPGWRIKEDAHPEWEFKLKISGTSYWQFDGNPLILDPNTLYAVAPGIRHAPSQPTVEAAHFLFCRINIEKVLLRSPELKAAWMDKPFFLLKDALRLCSTLQKLIRESISEGKSRVAITQALINLFLLEITRLDSAEFTVPPIAQHRGISRAVAEIERRFHEKLNVRGLAHIAGIASGHFGRVFFEQTGFSPRDYWMNKRIDAAKDALISTDQSISGIGMDLGFSSGEHFSREFKQTVGLTPRKYREQSLTLS